MNTLIAFGVNFPLAQEIAGIVVHEGSVTVEYNTVVGLAVVKFYRRDNLFKAWSNINDCEDNYPPDYEGTNLEAAVTIALA